MNFLNSKNSIFIVTAIMLAVASSLFIIIPTTPTFLIAYGFTVFAIVIFCGGKLYLLANAKTYPWFAAFPMTVFRYLIAQAVLSAVFLIRENFFIAEFPIRLFLFLHIILFGFFAVLLVTMNTGREIIEKRDAEVKQKVSELRLMHADVESVLRRNPNHEKPLRQVIEALKYSDPMSHSAIAVYDEQIRRSILAMSEHDGDSAANIPELCEKLLIQIADRNSRVKMMK